MLSLPVSLKILRVNIAWMVGVFLKDLFGGPERLLELLVVVHGLKLRVENYEHVVEEGAFLGLEDSRGFFLGRTHLQIFNNKELIQSPK